MRSARTPPRSRRPAAAAASPTPDRRRWTWRRCRPPGPDPAVVVTKSRVEATPRVPASTGLASLRASSGRTKIILLAVGAVLLLLLGYGVGRLQPSLSRPGDDSA